MAVSLQKGQKISLSKESAGLSSVTVGLGWDEAPRKKAGLFAPKPTPIDCDASVIILTNGKLASQKDVVYFKNLRHESNAIWHLGDNLTGAGDGDDEQIHVELSGVPKNVDKLVFVVNIYQAVPREQHFGMIQNAFCRIIDNRNNQEICRFNLSNEYNGMTSLLFCEVYRHGEEWKFNALGQGTGDPSLGEVVRRYV
jgi:stress response protein SCP2